MNPVVGNVAGIVTLIVMSSSSASGRGHGFRITSASSMHSRSCP